MSGPRYDRILASTALALILAAPLGSAAIAQEAAKSAAAPSSAVSAAQRAAAKFGAAGLDAAVKPQSADKSPAASPVPELAAASSAPATPKDVATAPARFSAAKDSGKDAVAPATPASPAVATEQVTAPDPLASLDPADGPIAEKIRDLLAAKADKIFANRKERAAVETFYQNRNLAPLWFDKGVENARAKAAIARIKDADADGLDADDYKTPNFAGMRPTRRRKPSCGSPRRCSPTRATCRPAASPIPASAARSSCRRRRRNRRTC